MYVGLRTKIALKKAEFRFRNNELQTKNQKHNKKKIQIDIAFEGNGKNGFNALLFILKSFQMTTIRTKDTNDDFRKANSDANSEIKSGEKVQRYKIQRSFRIQ